MLWNLKRQILTAVAVRTGLVAVVVALAAPLCGAATIGYVVDVGADIDEPFDIFWTQRLESQGHTIVNVGANQPAKRFPEADIFIISNDVVSGEIARGFGVDDPRPQISSGESGLIDDWGLADAQGAVFDGMTITIVDPAHPLAAGLSGDVDVFTEVQPLSTFGAAMPGPGTQVIATFDNGVSSVPAIALLEKGAETSSTALESPSPGRRVFLFSRTNASGGDLYTDDGLALLDAAVAFALPPMLQAGDANQDLNFTELDLMLVQIGGKYLTGNSATWREGDWDGAPGGSPGKPPSGNGLFDQADIVAALAGGTYLTGPYAAIASGGDHDDVQTSVIYNPATGELGVNAPASTELTSINIDSATAIFTGDAAENLGGSFDNDADNNIFKATFGSSFGSLSFGSVAQAGLSEEFVLGDLTVIGSLAGGGDLGTVDLIYVPEPSVIVLVAMGLLGVLAYGRVIRRE